MSEWLPGLIFAAVLLWLLVRDCDYWEREEAKSEQAIKREELRR